MRWNAGDRAAGDWWNNCDGFYPDHSLTERDIIFFHTLPNTKERDTFTSTAFALILDIFPLIDISYVLSALSMYSLILYDQIEQDRNNQREIARQQQEIARQRAKVTVLQMRPHFIYNTMTSIYYLCEQNPKKAMEMIDNFTNYLRKNFSAIAKNGTIPFKEELEYVPMAQHIFLPVSLMAKIGI